MIESIFAEPAVEGVNIHRTERGYQVHVRRYGSAFQCAQKYHATVGAALAEHLPKAAPAPLPADLMDVDPYARPLPKAPPPEDDFELLV